jgi:hypothetical protein
MKFFQLPRIYSSEPLCRMQRGCIAPLAVTRVSSPPATSFDDVTLILQHTLPDSYAQQQRR